jgi:hypothetical protein
MQKLCVVALCCSTFIGCATPNSTLHSMQVHDDVTVVETTAAMEPTDTVAEPKRPTMDKAKDMAIDTADTVAYVGVAAILLPLGAACLLAGGNPLGPMEWLSEGWIPPFRSTIPR